MRGIVLWIPFLLVVCAACATRLDRDKAFTDDWAYDRSRDPNVGKQGGEVVLTGKDGKGPRSALRVNEDGETQLSLGANSHLSTELSMDGGDPDVKLKYKIGF